jgi:hypothetical protein
MKNLLKIASIKLSPVFVVLITVAFAIFAFAMINLARLPTPEEKRQAFDQQMEDLMIAEEAQAMGGTVEEVKFRNQQVASTNRLIQELKNSIAQKDNAAVVKLISELKDDLPKRFPGMYRYAVNSNNEHAFRALLMAKLPCNRLSHVGGQAYKEAILADNPAFLQLLFEKNCDYSARTEHDNLENSIVKSSHPERIFLLPKTTVDNKYYEQALLKAINKKLSQSALTMLDLGVNPNTISKRRNKSALYLSLNVDRKKDTNMLDVAMRLVQKGAKIGTNANGGNALIVAVRKGHLGLIREMLAGDPDYLRRENLGETVFTSAFLYIKDVELRRGVISLFLENGVKPSKFKNGGIEWLMKAVRFQDAILVDQLLNAGIDPNIRSNMRLVLGVAKNIKIPQYEIMKNTVDADISSSPDKDKIIAMLEQRGATDDLLAIVRKEKGIESSADCRLGQRIEYKPGSIAKQYTENKHKKLTANLAKHKSKRIDALLCTVVLADCTNQGFGSDDCMHSIQTCGDSETNQDSLCCTNEIQKRYFKARCSGFDVKEAIRWSVVSGE